MSSPRAFWTSLRARFPRLLGHEEPAPDGHPTPAQLAAYHEDRLPPEKEEEIQEHFVECPECPDLMLGLDRFASKEMPVLVVDDLSDTRVDRAWHRLRRQLLAEVPVPRFPWPRVPRPLLLWLERPAVSWTLTCLLLLSTAGLGVRVHTLAAALRLQQAPQASPPVAMIPAVTRSAENLRAEFKVPFNTPRFLLMLESPADLSDCQMEIQTPQGEGVWMARGLTADNDGRFVVSLSPDFLPAGDYTIRLAGTDSARASVIQDYRVRFLYL